MTTGMVDDYPARSWSVSRYKSLLPRQAHLPEEFQRLWLYFGLFPNTVIYFYPEKAGFYMSLPQGAATTRVISREYRLPGENRELAAARYLSGRIDQITGREDRDLVRWLQEAADTSVFPLNNLSDLEDGVLRFHQQLKALVPVMSLEVSPALSTLADVNANLLKSSN
jgi:phenylpropionate dioxygenase-like ring-hydroxylating dioxygenase large terminal subunit